MKKLLMACMLAGCTGDPAYVMAEMPVEYVSILSRDLKISPEASCSRYDRTDYSYPQSLEQRIDSIQGGGYFGPYTKTYYESKDSTQIEHIVALREAHDSGMCDEPDSIKKRFGNDLLNLTLASRSVNSKKGSKDIAEWLPEYNHCWFAYTILAVKDRYDLSADSAEANTIQEVTSECNAISMDFTPPDTTSTETQDPKDTFEYWDNNKNGDLTCTEAKNPSPGLRLPAYRDNRNGTGLIYEWLERRRSSDSDNDGIACESDNRPNGYVPQRN